MLLFFPQKITVPFSQYHRLYFVFTFAYIYLAHIFIKFFFKLYFVNTLIFVVEFDDNWGNVLENIWILCLKTFCEVQDLAHSVNRSRISYVHSG